MSARDRHALLLAAGDLGRPAAQQGGQPQLADEAPPPLRVGQAGVPGDGERDVDVLLDAELVEEVERLENETHARPPQRGELVVRQGSQVGRAQGDPAAGRPVEAREQVHQGRLAGT
jgi:hypothetical protein